MAVKQFSVSEVLTASDTNAYLANSGLVYVTQVAIPSTPAQSTVVVANCFSSTYDNYLVSVQGVTASSGGGIMAIKYGTGTAGAFTPTTSGFYGNTFYIANGGGGGLSNAPISNNASGECGSMTNTSINGFTFNVNQPNLVARTFLSFQGTDDYYFRFGSTQHNSTTQFTGFQLSPSTGTFNNGTITVYGFRKGN